MKKLVAVLAVVAVVILYCVFSSNSMNSKSASDETVSLNTSDVFVFVKDGCPFCHYATKYIESKYRDDKTIKILNIYKSKNNMKLFEACAKREGIPESQRGTPLICFPDDAMLGWSEHAEKEFDRNIQKRNEKMYK